MKKIITACAAGLSLLALAPTGAHAAGFPDTDTVSAQTAGGAARGPVVWNDARGNGYASITVFDTYAPDNTCVKLELRRRYVSGAVQPYFHAGTVCNGRSWTFNSAIGPNGNDSVAALDVKVTRLGGYNNSDVYSVSPGGA